MKTFEELKKELLERAKKENACQAGYRMGLQAESKVDLLNAITENWFWVFCSAKIVDSVFLDENFTEKELNDAGIYTKGEHIVKTIAFVCGNSTVEAYGNATVKALNNSTVEAYGNATVEACGNSTVKAYDNSTVKACGNAKVEAYGNAKVEAYGNATVEAYDSSYTEDCTGNIRPQADYAIVKDYYNNKIYIKKGAFEIIEV